MLSNLSVTESENRLLEKTAQNTTTAVFFFVEPGAGQDRLAMKLATEWLSGEKDSQDTVERIQRGTCVDLMEIRPADAGEQIRLRQIVLAKNAKDQVPNVRTFLATPALQASVKVVLIHEAHRLNPDAANALLKMLEEPPEWGRFILTTESLSRIFSTIRSRCLLFPCKLPEPSDSPGYVLAGGAPDLVDKLQLEQADGLAEDFSLWVSRLFERKATQALKVSEEFQQFTERWVKLVSKEEEDEPKRRARALFIQMFGNLLVVRLREGDEMASKVLAKIPQMHRAILGNARFEYLTDALFTEILNTS
jgi:uncharacterized protein (DUF1778 family)